MLAVIAYDDDDDAVRIANNSIYGLSGAVFGSQERALRGGPPHPHRNLLASTAATTSAPTARSAATSSPVSAARWAWPGSRSSWRARPSRRWCAMSRPAGRDPRPRGRDVRVRPVGGAVLGRVGRRRHQGRARGHRRSAARPAPDRPAAGRGRPEPEHRARQPRQAQHRSGHVGARGQGGAARTRPARRRVPDQLPARAPRRSSASTSTTSAPSTRRSSTPAAARSARAARSRSRAATT